MFSILILNICVVKGTSQVEYSDWAYHVYLKKKVLANLTVTTIRRNQGRTKQKEPAGWSNKI